MTGLSLGLGFGFSGGTPTPSPTPTPPFGAFVREAAVVSGGSWLSYSVASGNNAIYDPSSNRTYMAWLEFDYRITSGTQSFRPMIQYYDHATQLWSQAYKISDTYLPTLNSGLPDDHGQVALMLYRPGKLFAAWGSHDTAQPWAYMTTAGDLSAWTQGTNLATGLSYNRPIYWSANDHLYLFGRGLDPSKHHQWMYDFDCTSGVPVPNTTPYDIIDGTGLTGVGRWYGGNMTVSGGVIIGCGAFADGSDTWRANPIAYKFNPATRAFTNMQGTGALSAASAAVNYTQLAANGYVVADNRATSDYGNIPVILVDSTGVTHLVYTVTGGTVLKHVKFDASTGVMSSPVTIGSGVSDRYQTACPVDLGNGDIRIFYVRDTSGRNWPGVATPNGTNRGGDLLYMDRSANGTLGSEVVHKLAEWHAIDTPCPVYDGVPEFAITFAEITGDGTQDILKMWGGSRLGATVGWQRLKGDTIGDAFAARCAGTVDSTKLAALKTAIQTLVNSGQWERMVAYYAFQGITNNTADALLNIVGNTANGAVTNMTNTATQGLTGNGTSSLFNSNYTPSTGTTTIHAQMSRSYIFGSNTNGQDAGVDMGVDFSLSLARGGTDLATSRISENSFTASNTAGAGIFVDIRRGGITGYIMRQLLYRDTTKLVDQATGGPAALRATPVYVGARSGTSGLNPTSRQYFMAGIGGGLSESMVREQSAAWAVLKPVLAV